MAWSSFDFCFVISLRNRVHELSIINISVGSRALLCCYDLGKVERIKEFILILWIVMISHIESMRHKSCWELMNVALVNDATHEKVNKGREDSHTNTLSWKSFVIVSTHQNIICQNCWRWTRIQLNDLCLFIFT